MLSALVNRLAPSATLAMSQKSAELKAQGVDIIILSVGEPDFNTPDHIQAADHRAIDENYSRYSPVAGYPALRQAIVAKLKQENGLDYNHGTGHGVGHLLSVHEGPQSISRRGERYGFFEGMITSNEPGYYLEGEYGIRLENEVLCVRKPNGMLGFETITFCPFEREAIVKEMLTDGELAWLNDYHAQVYDKLSPLLDENLRKWLAEACAEI